LWYYLALGLGVIIGSFLNVVIYRLPKEGLSVVNPPYSVCPSCGYKIKWYDNIPILSYILLTGRCRNCKTKISPRYPFVEACCAAGFFINAVLSEDLLEFTALSVILSCSLIIAFIDAKYMLIPDITLILTAIASVTLWIIRGMAVQGLIAATIVSSLLSLISFLFKGGMGSGDIILLTSLAPSLGILGSLYTIAGSSILALLMLIIFFRDKLKLGTKIPFGVFIAPVGYVFVLTVKYLPGV